MTRSRKISVCQGTGCTSSNSYQLYEALKAEIDALQAEVDQTGAIDSQSSTA